jgi:hypothetical protein
MSRNLVLFALALMLAFTIAAQAETFDFLPAGMLLTCTMDEPNFSTKTAEIGDPVLCHVTSTAAFGRTIFPRGAYLSGRLADAKDPGHFWGKGYMLVEFDRLVLPGEAIVPFASKIVAGTHIKIGKDGRIKGKGHATRDAVEWMIPVLWPIKVITLPARGPYPTLKGEQRLTLRLMEDVELPHNSRESVPRPYFGARPSNWNYGRDSYPQYRRTSERTSDQPVRTFDANATMIVLKDQSAFLGQSCQAQGNRIVCLGEGGQVQSVPMSRVDVAETIRTNRERGIPFTLASASVD